MVTHPKNKNIGWKRETLEEPSLLRYDTVLLSESKKFSLDCPTLLIMQALHFFEMLGTISPVTRCHIPKDSNHEQHHCENSRFCAKISNCETGDSHSRVDEVEGGSSGMQMFEWYQCFRENCSSIFSVEYVTPNCTFLHPRRMWYLLTDGLWEHGAERCNCFWARQVHLLLHAYLLQILAMEAANQECRPLTDHQHYPRQISAAAYVRVDSSASWRGGV